MTTYTMNGHSQSATKMAVGGFVGLADDQAKRSRPPRLSAAALPERFSCLESPEPRAQLQAALKRIDTLLQENAALRDTVFLLSQSLSAPHSLIHKDESACRPDRVRLRLLHDFHGCMEQLR